MFRFVVRHLRGLRFVPGLAFLFDCFLLGWSSVTRPRISRAIDAVTAAVRLWPGVSQGMHRFGGAEFRLGGREIGHLHGNGLLDIPLTTALRARLVADGRACPHHIYTDSGWIIFYIRSEADIPNAVALLRLSFERLVNEQTLRKAAATAKLV